MIIADFIKGRDVQPNAISNYIARHEEEFKGHIKRVGKNTELDEYAIRILEEKYPYPKPTTVITGIPEEDHLRAIALKDAEIQRLNRKMESMRDEREKLLIENGELKANILLLEDRKEQLKEKDEALSRERERADQERSRADELAVKVAIQENNLKKAEEEYKKSSAEVKELREATEKALEEARKEIIEDFNNKNLFQRIFKI